MTSAALLQRAAELVIEFGLDGSDETPGSLRGLSDGTGSLLVSWRPSRSTGGRGSVEIVVTRRTTSLTTRVNVNALGLSPCESRRVADLHGRVADLAARIEALR